MSDGAQRAGQVISVSGSKICGVLTAPPGGNGHDANVVARSLDSGRSLQIGNLVKIPMPKAIAYGLVSRLETRDPSGTPNGNDCRVVEIDLFGETLRNGAAQAMNGEAAAQFQRGISVYPSLGDEIHSASTAELAEIYKRPTQSSVRMGTLHQDQDLPVYLLTDELLGKHFAILGTS